MDKEIDERKEMFEAELIEIEQRLKFDRYRRDDRAGHDWYRREDRGSVTFCLVHFRLVLIRLYNILPK